MDNVTDTETISPTTQTTPTETTNKPHKIEIIRSDSIPITQFLEQSPDSIDLGECRELRDHPALNKFIPDFTRISMTFINLTTRKQLLPYVSPTNCLIVLNNGEGELIGDHHAKVKAGDMILVPANTRYGLAGSTQGLQGINIRFGERRMQELIRQREVKLPNNNLTYHDVLAHNHKRFEEFKRHPYFELIKSKDFQSNTKQIYLFLDCTQIFSDQFQKMMFARQACCEDKYFEKTFLKHLEEEFGHDTKLAMRHHKTDFEDPVLLAATSWFSHQMFILDNVDKAILSNLVIESSGDYYHSTAEPVLSKYVNSDFFHIHSELDEGHTEMGVMLLKQQHPKDYQRMLRLIDKGWDMINVFIARVVTLVKQAA